MELQNTQAIQLPGYPGKRPPVEPTCPPGSLCVNVTEQSGLSAAKKGSRGWFESVLQYVLAEYLETLHT